MLFFTSCIPVCLGFAYIDYENLCSNLNAPIVDKKLAYALEGEYFESVSEAVSDGANIDKTVMSIPSPLGQHDYSPISTCIAKRNFKLANLLLENGADPNYNNKSCSLLVYALMVEEYNIALDLIEHGADVNYSSGGYSPLSEFIKNLVYYNYPFTAASSADSVFESLMNKGAVMPQSALDEIIANAYMYDLRYIQRVVLKGDYALKSPLKEVISGDCDAALSYLKTVNSIDKNDKKSLIIFAAAFCNAEVIDRLIALGCDINTTIDEDANLLSVAARYNSPDVIEYLNDEGITAHFGGNSMKYCDYAAALNKNIDTLKYLYNLRGSESYFAIRFACLYGNTDYIKLHLNYIKTLNSIDKQDLVKLASFDDNFEIIKIISETKLDNFASVAEYVGTMSIDTIKYLLSECGLSPNDVDTDATGTTPFRFALASGDLEKVKLMIKYGADVNMAYPEPSYYKDSYPIFTAVYYSNPEIVEYLIENGVDIEVTDSYGYTPLMNSISSLSYNMAEILVNNGADLSVKNNDNHTAVDIAKMNPITFYDEKMMKILNS